MTSSPSIKNRRSAEASRPGGLRRRRPAWDRRLQRRSPPRTRMYDSESVGAVRIRLCELIDEPPESLDLPDWKIRVRGYEEDFVRDGEKDHPDLLPDRDYSLRATVEPVLLRTHR